MTDRFDIWERPLKEREYYAIVSALTEFKRVDLAVKAFNDLGLKLVVIGAWDQEEYLKSIARENIEFVGYKVTDQINEIYKNARWFVFPVKEDFGIAPVEAMSAWIPVFGLKMWWLLETVVEGVTWEFFDFDDVGEFKTKFIDFHNRIEEGFYDREKIRLHAEQFRKEVFFDKLEKFIESKFY